MDGVKAIDVEYDAHKDNHDVFYDKLRTDDKQPSMPTEKVLKNAVNQDNAFVVPKVVE